MIRASRQRFWRWGAVLPAVATAVAGTAVVATLAVQPGGTAAASFSDRAPIGVVEKMYQRPGGVRAIGWDFDPDKPTTALRTYGRVDGKYVPSVASNLARPDVAKIHPHAGPNHGFNYVIPVTEGLHTVCVYARNLLRGKDYRMRCLKQTFWFGPFGAYESLTAAHGKLRVRGWALDGDKPTSPITVNVVIDGVAHAVLANQNRPDVGRVHRVSGPIHGFDASFAVPQWKHTVCVTAVNVGLGSNKDLGCKTVSLNDTPRGVFESVGQRSGKLRITGWAVDLDAPTTPLTVDLKVDGVIHPITANATRRDIAARYRSAGAQHGYDVSYTLPEGSHTVCVTVHNLSFGYNRYFGCKSAQLNFTPTASSTALTATSTGARLTGWATDPDTSAAISVRVSLDGRLVQTVTANRSGSTHSGHNFAANVTTVSGKHTLCAVAVNALYGTHNSASSCHTITLTLSPLGKFESLRRASGSANVQVTGWALDPDTRSPLSIAVTVDGHAAPTVQAAALRNDVATSYPFAGGNHGIASTITTDDGEHQVCLTARNVGAGTDTSLGCRLVIAVHPVAPSAPQNVTALAGFGGATVNWTAPASDGGAPWTKYTITASPGGAVTTVAPGATTATVLGLKPSTTYTFTVQAVNVAGTSVAGTSPAVKTQASPPPQTTPAPVSTSRYIRNIRGASATELATMRSEGVADAKANPSGHGYLILLDIGGQDQYDGGVVLSATTRFVSYGDLVKDINAYVDGYASGQRVSAPVMIAIGTNNDMDVTSAAGKAWADKVVDPVLAYAKKYSGIRIAGANDIEPGFRASYTATKAWLTGYLGATSAPFVFNGSADGCAWTVTNRGCNNGWSMAGLYYLAAGAAPIRMLNLPQIYNSTMAAQWKYISLTGVGQGQPRINFAGVLTEWTACDQTNSCGSLTGHTAWSTMWSNLQSDSRLKVGSLPYSTDLRIDR